MYGTNSSAFTFRGGVSIDVNVTRSTREITLHKKQFTIDQVTVVVMESESISQALSIKNTSYDGVTEFFVITLDDELLPGNTCKVYISFHGDMRHDGEGLYVAAYKDNNETM